MKTLYIDCGSGAAGDMLTAGLLELTDDPDAFVKRLNAIGIPNVRYINEKVVKSGICGTHMSVLVHGEEEDHPAHEHEEAHECTEMHEHEEAHKCTEMHEHEEAHEHHHADMQEIRHIIGRLTVPENVKNDVLAVYEIIARAESFVHGVPVTDIHFHEVGTLDAVADITAVCLLMNELKPEKVIASPVQVGSGTVKCAHGVLPVPAPAAAYILRDIPIYSTDIKGEMCTPTGAALLKYFVTEFGEMPVMKVKKIGCGMGKKDFRILNAVRILLGETTAEPEKRADTFQGKGKTDSVIELACNIDDNTGEELGFAMERIFEAGAKDVFTIPIQMKKSRPAVMLCALCDEKDKENVVKAIFKYTATIGIRAYACDRYVLDRSTENVQTPYGTVRKKVCEGYGVRKEKPEYEDLARLALENNVSIDEIKRSVK